jgi:virB3-like protein
MDEFSEHPSYNALDRTAMFMGVPLLPAVLLLVVALFIFLVGGNTFGMAGFLFGFIVFPVFLFLRQISQTDDKALYILYLEIIFKFKRVAFKEFGNTLTFIPERYLDYEAVILQDFRAINSLTK